MATKVTFKKQPKETGLGAVGHPYQDIDCKIKKRKFGYISAPTWRTKDHKWVVRVMVMKTEPDDNPNCAWRWVEFANRFDDDEKAKAWLQENIDEIQQKYTLRFVEE